MTTLLGILFGIVFLEVALRLNLQREVFAIHAGSRGALRMLASDASDAEKEVAMRRASVQLFAATGMLILKFLIVGAALWLLYEAVVALFPAQAQPLQASFVSVSGIVLLTAATLVYAWVRHVALKRL